MRMSSLHSTATVRFYRLVYNCREARGRSDVRVYLASVGTECEKYARSCDLEAPAGILQSLWKQEPKKEVGEKELGGWRDSWW